MNIVPIHPDDLDDQQAGDGGDGPPRFDSQVVHRGGRLSRRTLGREAPSRRMLGRTGKPSRRMLGRAGKPSRRTLGRKAPSRRMLAMRGRPSRRMLAARFRP